MKTLRRYLIDVLPLVLLTLVVVVMKNPAIFAQKSGPLEGQSDRTKVVNAPENRQLPQSELWEVTSVTDGDTINVRRGFEKAKVRFACIDSPEKSQPLGKESKANLQRLISSANNQVLLSIVDTDSYGRKVAEVFTVVGGQEKFLQEEQLKVGLAYIYEQYIDNCLNADPARSAEAIARSNHVGVWSGSYTKPWEWRKQR